MKTGFLVGWVAVSSGIASTQTYPATIQSCNEPITFAKVPERTIAFKANLEDTGLTPEKLAQLGVDSYASSESCTEVGAVEPETLKTLYQDIRNIDAVFGVSAKAEKLGALRATSVGLRAAAR